MNDKPFTSSGAGPDYFLISDKGHDWRNSAKSSSFCAYERINLKMGADSKLT